MVGRGEDKIGEEGVGDKVVGFISHKFVVVCSSWENFHIQSGSLVMPDWLCCAVMPLREWPCGKGRGGKDTRLPLLVPDLHPLLANTSLPPHSAGMWCALQ